MLLLPPSPTVAVLEELEDMEVDAPTTAEVVDVVFAATSENCPL